MVDEQVSAATTVTVADLRRRFKAICEATHQRFQNYQFRVHRALSWLERALEVDSDDQPDGRKLFGWIAFNSLYGTWDEDAGFPAKDREALQAFIERILRFDRDELLGKQLIALRPQVLALLENKFLDQRFWREPQAFRNHRGQYHRALTIYIAKRWLELLTLALDRVYVLRGQIVHGAATRGSSLNRAVLKQCSQVLESLFPSMLHLAIEHGAHDDWPPLCYPPVYEKGPPAGRSPPARGRDEQRAGLNRFPWGIRMGTYSHSKLDSFRKCPRQFYYHYIAKVPLEKTTEQIATFLGYRVHEALEHLYARARDGIRIQLPDLVAHYREL